LPELRERQEGMMQIVEKLIEGGKLIRQMTQQQANTIQLKKVHNLTENKLRRAMNECGFWWMKVILDG
jgi:hypothetical protein